MPLIIGRIVSAKLATLAELKTVYGVKDAYDFLEIMIVDGDNEVRAHKWQQRQPQFRG